MLRQVLASTQPLALQVWFRPLRHTAKPRTTQPVTSSEMTVEKTTKKLTELWGAIKCGDARDAGIAVRKKERSFIHPAWVKEQLLHDLREAQE